MQGSLRSFAFVFNVSGGVGVTQKELYELLEDNPVIAAVHDTRFEEALRSPANVIFLLGCNLLSLANRIRQAKDADKRIFLHIDLSEGIGKDRSGIEYASRLGADGIISTRGSLIKAAKESGLLTVQRFFAYDSQGVESIRDMIANSSPDIVEIMPGVIVKIIQRFADNHIPLIAGGLIETKAEITNALNAGAFAVSTGKQELWYI